MGTTLSDLEGAEMSKIEKMMKMDNRCPDCGALLNEQNSCGNCGYEQDFHPGSDVIVLSGQAIGWQDMVYCLQEESWAA